MKSKNNIIKKTVISITTGLIIIALLALLMNLPYWVAFLQTLIDLGIFLILPWLLIGSLVKKSIWIRLLIGLLPGIIMVSAVYLDYATEIPPSYPPMDISFLQVLFIFAIMSIAGSIITSLGYLIQKIVDKKKGEENENKH